MSQENVEITRRGWDLWLGGGATAEAVPADYFHPDVEWDLSALPLVDLPTRGRGRNELMELFAATSVAGGTTGEGHGTSSTRATT